MTNEEAINIIKSECYVFNPLNFDRTTMVNTALDVAVEALDKEWVPCSERMPEPKETENLIAKYYLVQNEYGDMMVARWDGKGWEQMYQHEYLEDDIIAWMPLPEKYKTEMESRE